MPELDLNDRRNSLWQSQNFLHSKATVERIVALAQIGPGSTVLEIGPGRGIITLALRDAVGGSGKVIAIELDPKLAVTLRGTFSQQPHVMIVEADYLTVDLSWLPSDYFAFSNVPFATTSAVLDRLFHPGHWPQRAHLILQRDALEAPSPGGGVGLTLKSLIIHPWYTIEPVYAFRREDFTPRPAVDSALFAFVRRDSPLVPAARYADYCDFAAAVSKDRVGEGIWRRLFGKAQLERLARDSGLVIARGLKAQLADAIVAAFLEFDRDRSRATYVQGAMAALRDEQARREQINRSGDHRRKTRPDRDRRK